MTWYEKLRRVRQEDGRELIGASFRGVPFFVLSDSRSGGRRLVTHEFPFRNEPVIDDLGRKVITHSIVGYVLGDTYLQQRDALISALEDVDGPGELVHPQYAATLRVLCETCDTSQTQKEGGIARLTITFREAPEGAVAPVVVADLGGVVETVALLAIEAVEADLDNSYDVGGQPAFATASLSADASNIATRMGELLGPVVTAASELQEDVETAIQELAALDAEVAGVVADAAQLVRTPSTLFERLAGILESIAQTVVAAPGDVFRALLGVYDAPDQPAASGTTPTRELERANQIALAGAMREQSLMSASALIVQVPYASIDDALADRGELVDRLDAQILIATDAVYPRLVDVRAAVTLAIPGDEDLARITTVERRVSIPSLVLSHELYGSVDQEPGILARNPTVQHPGFMAGELNVLSG